MSKPGKKMSMIFFENAVEKIKGWAKMSTETLLETISAGDFYSVALDSTFGLPDNEAKEELLMLSKKAKSIADCARQGMDQKSWDATSFNLNPKNFGRVRRSFG